jgi:type I restriction enzyme, S subunit
VTVGLKTFEECIEKVSYGNKIQRTDYLTEGRFPVVSQESSLVNGYWNQESDVFFVDKPVIIFGDHTRALKYIDFNFVLGADGTKIIKPKEFIDSKFLYYFLLANPVQTKGYARHYRFLKELSLYVPSFTSQKKIVAKLDAIFAEIDKATAAAETNAKNAEVLFQSYLTNVFTRLVTDNKSVSLKDVSDFENGDRGKNYPSKQHQVQVGIPFINAGDLTDSWKISRDGMAYITEERFKILGAGKVKLGDILFCLRGSLGKCGIVEEIEVGAIASSLVIIRPLDGLATTKFLYWYLSSSICDKQIADSKGGAAQPNLSAKSVMNFQLPKISINSQIETSQAIDGFYNECQIIKNGYLKKIESMSLLKSSILKQAFSGELVKE